MAAGIPNLGATKVSQGGGKSMITSPVKGYASPRGAASSLRKVNVRRKAGGRRR